MKELLETIAKSLVDNPDEVSVNVVEKEDIIVLELHVGEGDMGKVIGRQGRIAKAIRTVIHSATAHSPKKVIVDII
ncbi:MAG: KH domain-containing protein [Clostridia bacterium]|nr:KH domain-containing protein [Clostridia bacterium]